MHALVLACIDVGLAVIAGVATTRVLASFLYGVSPTDPVTFFGTSLVLTAIVPVTCRHTAPPASIQ